MSRAVTATVNKGGWLRKKDTISICSDPARTMTPHRADHRGP